MSDEIKSSDSVELRLKRAEASLAALSRGEVDVLIGKTEPLIVRFRSLVEANERQRRLLDSLIETAPTLILLTDSRGRIVRYNRACEDNTGYSREEALGKTIAELFKDPGWADAATVQTAKPSDSQLLAPNVRQWLTKTGEKRSIEWRCVAGVVPEDDGYYVMGIGLDITLRKLAQDAAAEARRFAESIIATVREPLLVLDDTFRVKAANRSYYANFETEPPETIGRILFELGNRQWDTLALRQLLQTILSQNTSFDNFEVKHSIPRRGRRVLLLNARRISGNGNDKALILLAIEDATDKVNAWEALKVLNNELEKRVEERTAELQTTNKELEAFCYSVSHDLRAPLRAIDGFSDELLRLYAERFDEVGRHYLQRVRSGTKRMGELIDDLLKLSQYIRGEMKMVQLDMTGMAQAVAAELQQRQPERRVLFEIEPHLTARGDRGMVMIVLENLLGNAWKYTAKKPSANIAFGETECRGLSTFFVRDDGAGFEMNHADKLFGAFQRLHSQRDFPGNGIGLATVQRIVHRHGGEVWAESSAGAGATFYFTLFPQESP